jgi:DNA-binding Lrp family transcriptional regulator
MTPATEAEALLIELWNQGLEITVIAQRLGIPKGTVQSRAHRLQQRGLIQPRPRGGAYPSQRALARQHQAPVQRPVQRSVHNAAPPGAVHHPVHTSPDHPPPSPDLSLVLNALVERLASIEETLKQGGVQKYTPVQDYAPVQNYALPGVEPPRLSAADRKSERWNIYMPRWIRQRIEQAAAVEGVSPSQFLQRLCGPWAATWQAPSEEDQAPRSLGDTRRAFSEGTTRNEDD